jgi:hypothetical protein
MFSRFYSQPNQIHINMKSLLNDYEREHNPPQTCWERIKTLFQI